MLRLVVVRHGESVHNVMAEAAKEAGLDPMVHVYPKWWPRDTLLTANGERVLEERSARGPLAETLFQLRSQPHEVWSSPLRRATQTASIVYHGTVTRYRRRACCPAPEEEEDGDDDGSASRPRVTEVPTLRLQPLLRERCMGHGCNKLIDEAVPFAAAWWDRRARQALGGGWDEVRADVAPEPGFLWPSPAADGGEEEKKEDHEWAKFETESDMDLRVAALVEEACRRVRDGRAPAQMIWFTHFQLIRALTRFAHGGALGDEEELQEGGFIELELGIDQTLARVRDMKHHHDADTARMDES